MTQTAEHDPTEPGNVEDLELGVPGDSEPLPEDDAERDEPTVVHDDEDDADEDEDRDLDYGDPEDEDES